MRAGALALASVFVAGCGVTLDFDPPDPREDGGGGSDFGRPDFGGTVDGGGSDDQGGPVDGGRPDFGIPPRDGGPVDASRPDFGAPIDAGRPDAIVSDG